MFTSASKPKNVIFPRMRSEMRNCVTPNSLAACDWLRPCLRMRRGEEASKIKPVPLGEMAKRYAAGKLDPQIAAA